MNWKPILVFLLGAGLGFLLKGQGPIGSLLWPPEAGTVQPEGANLALLLAIGLIEAIAFGLGLCLLVFGLPAVRKLTGNDGLYATGVWLAVAWILMNWVPHTSLHMMVGNITGPSDYGVLVAIEYGFHLTLILAGALLMHAIFRVQRGARPTATG